jgi:kynurenine formamidase
MPEVYDGNGARSPQWWPSRYGADDELGAGNELTPERTLAALKLPVEGRCIELAQLLEEGVPAYPPRDWKQLILAHGALEQNLLGPGTNDMSYFEEHISATYHIGCHLDGLGHVGIVDRFYNGNKYGDIYTPTGLKKLGIHNVKPWVTRGVLLNIAKLLGTERLDEGFVITPEHLEGAEEAQGVKVQAGDVVLLHTGWGDLWTEDIERYEHVEPGAGWDAAHWLTDRRVSLVGADNWAFEVIPPERPDRPFAVHQHVLAETGTHILENIVTAELAETGRAEFLFVLTVQKSKGSTGAMASPVAVI